MHESISRLNHEPYIEPLTVEKVLVAGNRGPCGGVKMALEAAEQVLEIVNGREPVFTNWDIVNNNPAMQDLEKRGLKNVKNNLNLIPEGSVVFWSAHGIPPDYRKIADEKNLLSIDVTCQLVNRVHTLVKKAQENGKHIIYIGKEGHPETTGVLGELWTDNYTFIQPDTEISTLELPEKTQAVVYSQTTLATDEIKSQYEKLKTRYPDLEIPKRWDICPAVDYRQEAAEDLLNSHKIDFLLVGGSLHSHNSKELAKKAKKKNIPNALIDDPRQIQREWFTKGVKTVGATSGASEREEDFQLILDWFRGNGIDPVIYLPQIRSENDKAFILPQKDIDKLKERYR